MAMEERTAPAGAEEAARPCLFGPFCSASPHGACLFHAVCDDFAEPAVFCRECVHASGADDGFVCRRVPRKPVPMPLGGYCPCGIKRRGA